MSVGFYLDTSVLVKVYVEEPGSLWIRQAIAPLTQTQLYLSGVAKVEFTSAVARKLRDGEIDLSEAMSALNDFYQDWTQRYTQIAVDEAILNRANEVVMRHFLRAYDAVHLASALTVRSAFASLEGYALVFVFADQRLLQCAQQEGLRVENPLNYS